LNRLKVLLVATGGTCPSSIAGTLMAIESILKDEFDPAVEVIPV
jgi:Fe-S cluster biogenesis protein NfuA